MICLVDLKKWSGQGTLLRREYGVSSRILSTREHSEQFSVHAGWGLPGFLTSEEVMDCCGPLVDIFIFFLSGREASLMVDSSKGLFLHSNFGIDCSIECISMSREASLWWLRTLGITRSVFFFGSNHFVLLCMIEGWPTEVAFEVKSRLQVTSESLTVSWLSSLGWFFFEALSNSSPPFIKSLIDSTGRQDSVGIDKFVCVVDSLHTVFWGESSL